MINRSMLGSPLSGICDLYKLGSKSTRTCSVNDVLAKSVETGLPRNISFGIAAYANSDKFSIIIVAN
jgi:hypothetical protein